MWDWKLNLVSVFNSQRTARANAKSRYLLPGFDMDLRDVRARRDFKAVICSAGLNGLQGKVTGTVVVREICLR